ncbi:MAG: Ig-like domain-containing protein, partial [Gammaproteobacteria bacterium]|nr:Ig-like domain-containing protein [Gammaproteobacteria bacterium]
MLKISLTLPLISFLFLLASCGGSNTDDLKTQTVSSLSIFPLSITATALNQKFLLNAVVKDTQGQSIAEPGELVWKSSDDTIATVDAFGEVTTHAIGEVSITAILADVSGDSSVSVNESGDVIKGVAKYEDRLYSTAGFIGYAFNFVRYATVELLDESGKVLTTTATNEVGEYELGNIIPDKYSIRLLAEVKAAPAPNFSVRDMNGALYSYKKTSVDSTLIYPFDLGRSLSGTGAFNLLDVAIISSEYSTQVLNADVNDLQIYWESGYALNATYYCTGYDSYDCFNDKGIYVTSEAPSSDNGGQPDTDEFDDDVIMHEFGHFLTGNYSVDDSVGGPHLITQNDSDLRLSWSEGWGTFFPSAVKYWLKTTRPELVSSKTAVTT